MIIQIAGTSGSGKSHLVRELMRISKSEPHTLGGGKDEKIIGYDLTVKGVARKVYVIGSYAVPTGGCDTIKSISLVYTTLLDLIEGGRHVVFEGLFAMNQTKGPELAAEIGKQYAVLALTTPLGTCLSSINARRAARGEDPLLKQKNTKDNYGRATAFAARMRDAGALVKKVSRDEALPTLLGLLRAAD